MLSLDSINEFGMILIPLGEVCSTPCLPDLNLSFAQLLSTDFTSNNDGISNKSNILSGLSPG